jgi:hypothetical protein
MTGAIFFCRRDRDLKSHLRSVLRASHNAIKGYEEDSDESDQSGARLGRTVRFGSILWSILLMIIAELVEPDLYMCVPRHD